MATSRPIVALTQGDPAGVGPEILLKLVAGQGDEEVAADLVLIAERAALESVRPVTREDTWARLTFLDGVPSRREIAACSGRIPVLDPLGERRTVRPGRPGAADAAAAIAALDAGIDLVGRGEVDALVTAPLSKASVARHHLPEFRGHTDYLASRAGLERYGRDYLMAFLTVDLQVALLTTHLPLARALQEIRPETVEAALACLDRHAGGRIALAGLNPHAGEEGLLGDEESMLLAPAVARARSAGVDVVGPESPDSVFFRAREGAFDWVLALYHDQGLIAVKTVAFGAAANWTLGLPYLRTSVDHGTAFEIAGRGVASAEPLRTVVRATLGLLAGRLPRGRRSATRRPDRRAPPEAS